jgi:hypothetical protein
MILKLAASWFGPSRLNRQLTKPKVAQGWRGPAEILLPSDYPVPIAMKTNLPSLDVPSILSTSMPMVLNMDRDVADMTAFLSGHRESCIY